MKAIQPGQLDAWLAQVASEAPADGLPVVLDVREPWELQTASVTPDGFELRHMPMRSVPERLAELDRDQPIACLCHHGMRSAQVVNFLMQPGIHTDREHPRRHQRLVAGTRPRRSGLLTDQPPSHRRHSFQRNSMTRPARTRFPCGADPSP